MEVHFPDGARIHQDPRREDPLIYYLPTGRWGTGIAIEIVPLYEEHTATSVHIRFWNEHLGRLQALNAQQVAIIIQRFADTLSHQFPHWTELTMDWPEWLIEHIGERALTQPFVDTGWQVQSHASTSLRQWSR